MKDKIVTVIICVFTVLVGITGYWYRNSNVYTTSMDCNIVKDHTRIEQTLTTRPYSVMTITIHELTLESEGDYIHVAVDAAQDVTTPYTTGTLNIHYIKTSTGAVHVKYADVELSDGTIIPVRKSFTDSLYDYVL